MWRRELATRNEWHLRQITFGERFWKYKPFVRDLYSSGGLN